MFETSSGAALHAPLDKFGALPPTTRLHLLLFSQFRLFVPLATLRRLSRIAWTASATSPCDITFALLLSGKCLFVSLRISWPNTLQERESRYRMSLLWVHTVLFTKLFWVIAPCQHRRRSPYPSNATSCFNSSYHTLEVDLLT